MKRKILVFLICLSAYRLSTQTKTDLLLRQLNITTEDTSRLKLYYELVFQYLENKQYETALEYADKMLSTSYTSNSPKSICDALFLKTKIYYYQENFELGIKTAFECLKQADLIDYKSAKAKIFVQIGNIFIQQKNNSKAIIYYQKAIKLARDLNDYNILDVCYGNLAIIYQDAGKLDSSLIFNQESLSISSKLHDSLGMAGSYANIGTIYYYQKKHDQAEFYYRKSLVLFEKYADDSQAAIMYLNIASIYDDQKKHKEARVLILKAIDIWKKLRNKILLVEGYNVLSNNFYLSNEFEKAYEAQLLSKAYSDSSYTEEISLQNSELQTKYETEKKEKENQVLTLGNKNKQLIIYFAFGGCVLLLGLVFFIFKGYRTKKKANYLLKEKNEIIHQQKALVEEQHQDITDSIKYAQRIQGAILPPKNMWDKILPNSFVLYMPKDILSGDFYWIEETKDYIYVAAADCTGHGVPGALISIVNFNLLNKAVLEKGLVLPSEILDAVNLWLTDSLHQTYRESAVRDGMDVTLIAIHKHSNEVLFTGANNPIYIVSNDELKQIKGDKFPVGAFVEDQIQKFTTKRFTVNKGDCIYLFSDGFADQFGGDNGKKYKYAPFQQKLITISDLPLPEQRKQMKEEFNKWKGKHEQVDDVLLVGIKIV